MSVTIPIEQWEAKGRELFGDDKEKWRIQCPTCGNICSIELAREKHSDVKGKGWSPSQECIGRYTDAVDCDWCAYGLFHGPLFVKVPDKDEPIPCFDFEGLPFTRKEPTPGVGLKNPVDEGGAR